MKVRAKFMREREKERERERQREREENVGRSWIEYRYRSGREMRELKRREKGKKTKEEYEKGKQRKLKKKRNEYVKQRGRESRKKLKMWQFGGCYLVTSEEVKEF